MKLGIADHFGWAVAVSAAADHRVLDRRRLLLVEPGVTAAPIHYDAKHVEREAASLLGEQADEILHGPRTELGPPWTKDHRVALAATIVAG